MRATIARCGGVPVWRLKEVEPIGVSSAVPLVQAATMIGSYTRDCGAYRPLSRNFEIFIIDFEDPVEQRKTRLDNTIIMRYVY